MREKMARAMLAADFPEPGDREEGQHQEYLHLAEAAIQVMAFEEGIVVPMALNGRPFEVWCHTKQDADDLKRMITR